MFDPTQAPLLYPAPTASIAVDHLSYPAADGPLALTLYRPPGVARPPVVVIVNGYPDPGMAALFGRPLAAWRSYQDWARLLAAAGVAAVLYENRTPADLEALLAHLRTTGAALGVDGERLGLFAASGHAALAVATVARAPVFAAALLYGYTLDLDGDTAVADAARQFHFAAPPVALASLPSTPILLVRAGADALPGLLPSLDRFAAAAVARGLPVEVHEVLEAPHGFDVTDDRPATRDAIAAVVRFLVERGRLATPDE